MSVVKKSVLTIIVVVALFSVAAAYRYFRILPYPMGGGQSHESPDKKFTADAFTMTDCTFFGGERRYYEFVIETGPRQHVRRMVVEELPEGMIEWRDQGTIHWAADSSVVTFSIPGTQFILSVKP